MKKQLIFAALLSTTLMVAQNSDQKTATVRIKKVEMINGVETVTDTTYTTNDPALMKFEEMNFDKNAPRTKKQVIIIDDEKDPKRSDAEREMEVNKVMKELEENSNSKTSKESANKKCYSKTVTIKINLEEPNEKEMKKIVKQNGETDGKLNVQELKFFPSPSNGQSVHLSLELPEKGDTEINVLDMEGKSVFNEKLINFSGTYNKTIDISNNAKGVYFVRVVQGKHAQVKKIVLE